MSILFQYLCKLSISMAVVWLFYQLLLRKLTFYNSNRWYLLGYSALCFFIPFINVNPIVENGQLAGNVIRLIPAVHEYTDSVERFTQSPTPVWSSNWDKWDWALLVITLGMVFLFLRFCTRLFSYLRLKRRATLLSEAGMKLYHVDDPIIPFSFGNSIFINSNQHNETELQEIIRHEFVHVKQRHTVDILWGELLCMINWYNPFAWLIRASIRQNLEFIADHKVLLNGINKKEYQYMLLKVIGNNHFSIAQNFNFSSLKKRIAMMNKIKTARVHLLRFLFILPLLAVVLVSFRKQIGDTLRVTSGEKLTQHNQIDTVPSVKIPNEKGYYIDVIGVDGNCTVVIKDKNKKEVTRLLLNDWTKQEDYYEGLYGKIPPPPPPDPPMPPASLTAPEPPAAPVPAGEEVKGMEDFLKRNPEVKSVGFVFNRDNNVALVHLLKKDGTEEKIDLRNAAEKRKGEKKYGKFPEPSIVPPTPPAPPARGALALIGKDGEDKLASECEDFEITDKKAVMRLKNGKVEEYDLTNIEQRRSFEKKYGKIINIGGENAPGSVVMLHDDDGQTILAPMNPLDATKAVLAIDHDGNIMNGDVDVLVTISKNVSRKELDDLKVKLKEKGITLTYESIEYDNKGILVHISGKLVSKDGHCNFSATDFSKVTLSMITSDGRRPYFKVDIGERKVRV